MLVSYLPSSSPAAVVLPPAAAPDRGGNPDLSSSSAADLAFSVGDGGSQQGCPPPPMPAGSEVELAPEFAPYYKAYVLGAVPGVPDPLGGTVVKAGDASTLLVAGGSESDTGAIYSIGVQRDACSHIIGFVGSATKVADTPYVDANLVYGPQQLLVYTGWPQFNLAQLPASATMPARNTDLRTLGMSSTGDQGPGGHGFVPSSLPAATGQLRLVTWPAGHWYHVTSSLTGGLYDVTALSTTVTLPNNPADSPTSRRARRPSTSSRSSSPSGARPIARKIASPSTTPTTTAIRSRRAAASS